jgi:hypothetical protein
MASGTGTSRTCQFENGVQVDFFIGWDGSSVLVYDNETEVEAVALRLNGAMTFVSDDGQQTWLATIGNTGAIAGFNDGEVVNADIGQGQCQELDV